MNQLSLTGELHFCMVTNLSITYSIIIFAVICFQIALIFGAPWGRITQGGTHDGALPLKGRIIAAISIALLFFMILAMLSITGRWPNWPAWTGWVTVAINLIMCVLNWITPSRAERKLWGPITTMIVVLSASIMLL
jgi:hypothetical protein